MPNSEQEMRTNPNSALYWYPKLEGCASEFDAALPESEFVRYEFMESFGLIDGAVPDALPWEEFVQTVESIGYPAFLRTDQKSVKHAGPGAYKATEPDDIPTILAVLTDHHVKANRHPAALMVREFVDINAAFRAFDGLPIGRELRVFASPNGPECEHFYWPPEAIDDGRGEPVSMDGEAMEDGRWRSLLGKLTNIPAPTVETLRDDAVTATSRLNNADSVPDNAAWSVDFAEDTDGKWWLIDVALAEDSWHPECDSDG